MKMKTFLEKISENLPAKIICLVLALFIYLIYQFSTLSRKNFSVPLEVKTEGEFVPASAAIKTIRVSVRGNANDIIQLQENDFTAYLDVSYFTKEGTYAIPVQINLSPLATAFSPLEVQTDPDTVSLKIEPRVTVHIPIKPAFSGVFASGYELDSVKLSPDFAQITGARSLVAAKTDIETQAIALNDAAANFSLKTTLNNKNSLVTVDAPNTLTAAVTVKQKVVARSFVDLPITLTAVNKRFIFSTEPSHVQIIVAGFERQIENFIVPDSAIHADCASIVAPGTYEIPLTVTVPPEYTIEKIIPEKIIVTAAVP